MKYQRRTDDDRIAELNAKIESIRDRAARKAARANPAVRQATIALKAVERATRETDDAVARKALGDAREPLSAWLALEGLVLSTATVKAESVAAKRGRKRNNTAIATA